MRGLIVYGLLAIMAMLAVQSNAVKCHDRLVGNFPDKDIVMIQKDKATVKQCKESCFTVFAELEVDSKKFAYDMAACFETTENSKIFYAVSSEITKIAGFNCNSDLCNVKDSSEYKQTMTLQNAVDEVAPKLKGKSTDLKCHDENGTSVDCKGFCAIARNYTDETVDSTRLAFLLLVLPSIATAIKCLDTTTGNLTIVESPDECAVVLSIGLCGYDSFGLSYYALTEAVEQQLKHKYHEGWQKPKYDKMTQNTNVEDVGFMNWQYVENRNSYTCAFVTKKSLAFDGTFSQFGSMVGRCTTHCSRQIMEIDAVPYFAEGGMMDPAKVKALLETYATTPAPETTSAPETTTSYSNGYSLFLSIIVVLAVFNM